ncbi:hypothetical protein Aperf_G00000083322 [Anoplocephala perfoliata]
MSMVPVKNPSANGICPVCPRPKLLRASSCSPEGQMTELYEVYEKRDCKCKKLIKSLQKTCPCKPCRTSHSGCDPQTKTEEVTEICYRRTDNGRCEPVRRVTYEPCGDCPNEFKRKELPCDYCKGKRDVVFATQFREESGQRRCLVSEERKSEPCECKQGITTNTTCVNNDSIMRRMEHTRQISCDKCETRSADVLEKRIKCRGEARIHKPCIRDPVTGIGSQEIHIVSELPVNCTCSRSLQVTKEVCSCPKGVKEETLCHPHTNSLIVKIVRYRLQKDDKTGVSACNPIIQLKQLSPPPCPPINDTSANQRRDMEEICNPETCERCLVSNEWQLEGCECRKLKNKIPAGKCCCPKPEIKTSPCIGNQQSIQKFTYGLVNGQCLQHITNKIESCKSDLQDSHRVYCDEVQGAKVYETSTFRQLPVGTLETVQRRTIPVVCNETYIEGTGDCKLDPSTGSMVRTAVVMSSEREAGCKCSAPRAHIINTACECIDIETGEVKRFETGPFKEEIPCSPECEAQSRLCGSPACQQKTRWYRLTHVDDAENRRGTLPKCKRELIKEAAFDCCCPPDSEVSRTCDLKAGSARWQLSQTKYFLEGGRCTPHEIRWQEPLNCTEGLVGQERGPKLPDGLQEVQLIFETLIGCKCVRGVKRLQCPWRCPEPTQKVYCDTTMGGKSIIETTRFNLIGCSCQKQVQKKQSKIICPVYSEVVSRNCSVITGEATIVRRRMIQDGCACKIILETSQERCGCPPERKGKTTCNPVTNELETSIIKSILIGGKCQEVSEVEKQPIRCSNESLTHQRPILHCNEHTGQGELVKPEWRIQACKCIPVQTVLKRGQCKCGPPNKHVECSPNQEVRIHHLTTFTLNEGSLQCIANTTVEEEPFACPKSEIIYTPCDPLKGERKMLIVSFAPENCACKRQEEERTVSCRCRNGKKEPSEPICDVLRREFSSAETVQEWRDDLNKCADVVKHVSYPHVCSPVVKFTVSPCKNGKMEVKKVTKEADPNACKCVTNVTIRQIDCRCPPKKLTIGKCDPGEETQILAYLERDWDPKSGKCVITNRYQEQLVCDCPTATEHTSCVDGMLETKRTRQEIYRDRLGCKREEEVQRWTPECSANETREEYEQCDLSTCQLSLGIYTQVYNSSTCSCDWKLKEKRNCSCCGCPERKVTISCHNNTDWTIQSDYYVPEVKGCAHTCRKRTTITRQPMQCDQPNERKTGSCDPLTCRRPIYEIKYSRDKESCVCQPEEKLIGSEDCCCLPPPKPTKTCVGGCFVNIQILANYDEKQKSCVHSEIVTRQCPTCPLPSEEIDPCGSAGDCLQRVRQTHYDLEDCKCKRRQSVSTRNCCCLQPTTNLEEETPTCLPEENVLLHHRTVYDIVGGECVNRTEDYREPVECPPRGANSSQTVIERDECDKTTCLRKIRESKWILNKCRCQQLNDERSESCCCDQFPPKIKEICRSDGTILKETKYWRPIDGKCKSEVLVEVLPRAECTPIRMHPAGSCDAKTGRQSMEVVKYELKDCKCHPVSQAIKDRQCRCREDEIDYGICDSETCLQNVTMTRYKREAGICIPQPTVSRMQACCCLRDKSEPNVSRDCDRKTGSIHEITTKHIFDAEKHQCQLVKAVRIAPVEECRDEPLVKRGECNTVSGMAIDIVTRSELVKGSCSCKKTVNSVQRICDCRHMAPIAPETFCNEQTGELITSRSQFVLKDNACMNTTETFREKIVCPPAQKSYGSCDSETCQAIVETISFILKGCKCVQQQTAHQETCCCPEPQVTEECHENGTLLVQRHLEHKYNPEKKLCEPSTKIVRQPVECDLSRSVTISQYCDKKTCLLNSLVEMNILQDCKCIPKRLNVERSHKQCCCAPAKERSSCDNERGIVLKQRESYTLQNGSCIPKMIKSEISIHCPELELILGPCDHKTKKQEMTAISYELVNCKCEKRFTRSTQPCVCPLPKTTRRCEDRNWVTQKYTFRLVEHNGITDCVKETETERIPVICPQMEQLSFGECIPKTHQRTSTFRQFVVDPMTCKCIPRVGTKLEACDCHKKNRKETICNGSELLINSFEYFSGPGDQNCSLKSSQEIRPINCPTKREVISENKGCVIKRENGTYRAEISRWYELSNCECLMKEEVTEKLCDCPPPKGTSECENNSILITENFHFIRQGENCVAGQKIIRRKVECEAETRIVDVLACKKSLNDTEKCYETVVIEHSFAENCKCQKKTTAFKRLCCAPRAKTSRRCDEEKHEWRISTITFSVIPGDKVLFASGNVAVLDNKIVSIKDETADSVVCPAKIVQEHCDDGTGVWTQNTTQYIPDGCSCKKQEKVKFGKCVCPNREIWTSNCENHFRTMKIKAYKHVNGECLPHETTTRERCSCPGGSTQRIKCDGNGQFTKCTLSYEFIPTSRRCKTKRHCVSWKQPCQSSKQEKVGTCGPETGYRQKVSETSYILDKATCKCKPRVVNKWDAFCACEHLNTQNVSCEDGVKVSVAATYKLSEGECIPDEDLRRERIGKVPTLAISQQKISALEMNQVIKLCNRQVCPKPKEDMGDCDRDPSSPTAGLQIKTIHKYEIVGCECIPRTTKITEVCVCDQEDFGPKMVQGPCIIGEDGIGRQIATHYGLRPVKCRCERTPVKITSRICSCRKPSLERKCLNNNTTLVEIRQKYALKMNTAVPICVEKHSERSISPCSLKGGSKSWEVRGACDPSTCLRMVQVYKRAPQGCQCPTKRLKRMEKCCCPQPTSPQSICLAESNTFEKTFLSYVLRSNITINGKEYAVDPYCVEMKHKTLIPISCAETKPEVKIEQCQEDNHQIVRVIGKRPVGCTCEDYETSRMRIHCGCPKDVKYTYGECTKGLQLEKMIALQPAVFTKRTNGSQPINETSCQPIVISRRYLQCACTEKAQFLRKCLPGNRLQVEKVNSFFNNSLRTCQKETIKWVYPTTCPQPKRSVSQCGGEEIGFTAIETMTAWIPIDCECVPKIMEQRFVCNCTAKYPPRAQTECKDDRILETTTTSFRPSGHKCVQQVSKSTAEITCSSELRPTSSPTCDEKTHKRQVTWMKQVPKACKCEWQPVTSETELKSKGLESFQWCGCPESLAIDSKCIRVGPNQYSQEKTLLKYLKRGADCIPVNETLFNNFTCLEGNSTHRSECDPLTGQLVEHQVTQQVNTSDCSCRRVAENSRNCACNCGGASTAPMSSKTVCHAAIGVLETIEEVAELVDCDCRRRLKRTSRAVECPSGVLRQSATECTKGKNGDIYRNVTWTTGYREGCRCLTKKHSRREICSCAPQEHNFTRCVDNTRIELKTLRRALTGENKCVEKEVARTKMKVVCPESRVIDSVCNIKTGFAVVSKEQPVVEKCICKTRMQQFKVPCKCNPLEKLVYKSPCNASTCLSLSVYTFEVPDATKNNSCSLSKIVKESKCCCPPPQSEQICDSYSGMLRTRVREFRLVNGECMPVVRTVADPPVICPKNETTAVKILKSGKIRFLRKRTVREGCACRNVSETALSKWRCPKPTQSRECVKLNGPDKYAWRISISTWKSSKGKVPTCKHHEVRIDETPVTCSPVKVEETDCFFSSELNGYVKNVTTKSIKIVDCRCIPQEPFVKQIVCNCSKPVVNVECNGEDGLIIENITYFNTSVDGSQCIPRDTRRQWHVSCVPSSPILHSTTLCRNGLLQKIYVKRKRDGCHCRTLVNRVSLPCECPKTSIETTCLGDGITLLINTTTYAREHLNAPCKREEKIIKKALSCDALPESELQAGRDYTIRQDASDNLARRVFHVYPCGTGGSPCARRVLMVTAVRAKEGCRCEVRREESIESCCCNANGQTGRSQNLQKSQWMECETADHPISVRQQRSWRLVGGKCWPIILTSSKPLVCSDKEVLRPLGICVNGTQRFAVIKSVRDGCRCKTVKSTENRSCLCQTVSAAEVVFVVDESVSSRVPDYSRRVRDILQLTIRTFKGSHNNASPKRSFRFAVVKYSSDPSIAFNLDQYEEPIPMLNHVERLSYEGHLSNLGRALVLTKNEILPRVRAGIPTIIYIISDGVNDISEGARELASEIALAGVRILTLAVGADSGGKTFLRSLASKPQDRHFMVYTLDRRNEELVNWLINSLCVQACPESTQTRSACSRDTGCLGHFYEQKYQYNADLGKCVGVSVRRPYRCCCLEEPKEEKQCINGSLILTREMWKLSTKSKNGLAVCQHFKFIQDLTGDLLKDCRTEEVQLGECSSDGIRKEVTIRRRLENCECKETRYETVKRCFCDAKARGEKHCIGDDQHYLKIRREVLNSEGQCSGEETVVKTQIQCSEPKVTPGKCDPMTCKRRVLYYREHPELCECKKQFKVAIEPCCCLGPQTNPKEKGCVHRNTQVTTEKSAEFDERKRACVMTTERIYELINCPKDPIVTKSNCGHFGSNDGSVGEKSDPNLLLRRVEITFWHLENCECVPSHRFEFEACGCSELNQSRVLECHEDEGILISYQQNFVLSVTSSNQTYSGLKAIGKPFDQLEQAKCTPIFSGQVITQIVCPDDAITRGPCIYDDEVSRGFRNIEKRSWKREGCKCKQLPARITRELCGCRRQVWTQKRCSGREASLRVSIIQEKLTESPHGPKCKIDVQTKNETIKCPSSQINYSNCSEGEMMVIIELVSPRGCKCETTRLTRKLRCIEIAMTESVESPLGIKGKPDHLPTTSSERFQDFEKLRERLSNLGLSDIQEPPDFIEEGSIIEQESEDDILRRIKQQEEASGNELDFVESVILKGPNYRPKLPKSIETPGISVELRTTKPGHLGPEEELYYDQTNRHARKPTKLRTGNVVEEAGILFMPGETKGRKYVAENRSQKLELFHHKSTIPQEMAGESTINGTLQTSMSAYEIKTTRPSILPESGLEEPVYHRYKEKSKSRKMYEIGEEPSKIEITQETQFEFTKYPRHMKPPELSRRTSGLLKPVFYETTTQPRAKIVQEFGPSANGTEVPKAGFSGPSRRGVDHGKTSKKIVINAIECVDLLDSEKCAEKDKGPVSECEKPGQIRDELCRKTCHVCQDFPFNETEFKVQDGTTNDCLMVDVRYEAKYHLRTLKEAGLSKCKAMCSREPHCLGFDFYIPVRGTAQGSCVLGTIDRLTLQRRLNENAKTRLKSENPLAFTISPSVDTSQDGRKHCVKDAVDVFSKLSEKVTCQSLPSLSEGHGSQEENSGGNSSNPDPCFDVKPTEWCEEAARTASCRHTSFRAVCGGTCGVCVCDRIYEYVGRCLPNGKMSVVKIENTFSPLHGRCISRRYIYVAPCEVCPAKPYELVQSCNPKTESRLLIHVSSAIHSSNPTKCDLKLSKKELSCQGCMFESGHSIERSSISRCKKLQDGKYRLILRTEYVVSENGCCKIRKSYRSFPCLGCAEPKVGYSECLDGWQMRAVVFFTRPSTGKFSGEDKKIPPSACFKHVISTKERCFTTTIDPKSNCSDLLGLRECQEFKSNGQCFGEPEMAQKLCAKQCNIC